MRIGQYRIAFSKPFSFKFSTPPRPWIWKPYILYLKIGWFYIVKFPKRRKRKRK